MISPHLLKLTAAYSYRTYGGCMEGAPSPAVMIESAKQQSKELWGGRATFIIEPKLKGKLLPTWTHMVMATGPVLGSAEEMDGSELCVIWWSELSPSVDRVLDAVDWEKHARNFGY